MASIKNIILAFMSCFMIWGCAPSQPAGHKVLNLDYMVIKIKSEETAATDQYINIWIDRKTSNEQLEIEKSLTESNISFRKREETSSHYEAVSGTFFSKQEYEYTIDGAFSGFRIRNIWVTKRGERIILNNQDITDIGNVAISKNSEITLGAFYRNFY